MSIHTSALWCGLVQPNRMVVSLLPTCTCVLGRPACPAISTPKYRRPSRSSGARSAPVSRRRREDSWTRRDPTRPAEHQARVAPGGRRDVRLLVEAHPGARFEEMWHSWAYCRMARRDPGTGVLADHDDGPRIPTTLWRLLDRRCSCSAPWPRSSPRSGGSAATKGRYEGTPRGPSEMVELEPLPGGILLRIIVTSTVFPRGSNNDEYGTSSPNRVV